MTQGRCDRCKVRWDWERSIPRRKIACPCCGGPVWQTTHLLRKFPTRLTRASQMRGWVIASPKCRGACLETAPPEVKALLDRLIAST